MREELRRSNTIGDSKGILYFADIVLRNGEIKRESARQICSFINDIRINFNSAVAFFEYLGFISVSLDSLIPTEDGKKLLSLIGCGIEEALCEACLDRVTKDSVIDITALRFDTIKDKYYIQRHGFPINAAVFRNVLIQLSALSERGDGTGSLELSDRYEAIFAKVQKNAKRKMSLEALKKQMEKQELQGETAEAFVLEYEIARLAESSFAEKIKRISDIDVSAGYDIVSFENDSSSEYDRFIEVKSYLGQPHFYWSNNEIEIATLYGEKYFLYLVSIEKIGKTDYRPTIIRNPAKSVIESDGWLMQPTSFLVLPTEM